MWYLIHAFQYEINKEVGISSWDNSTLFPCSLYAFGISFCFFSDVFRHSCIFREELLTSRTSEWPFPDKERVRTFGTWSLTTRNHIQKCSYEQICKIISCTLVHSTQHSYKPFFFLWELPLSLKEIMFFECIYLKLLTSLILRSDI